MKVSVLIPAYNCQEYIKETIKSVLNQTYENIEVIIVDDGSSDDTCQIAKQYEKIGVKVFSQINQGAAAARNKAFEHATGDYIQYLDADDLLHPQKIKFQIDQLAKTSNKTVASGYWGRFSDTINDVCWEQQEINKDYENPINWLIDSWNGKGMGALHSWLIPSQIIKETGSWNTDISLNDDGEFFCRVLLKAKTIRFVKESKAYYRSYMKNSLSQTKSIEAIHSELLTYQLYAKHCSNINSSLSLRKALANNFLNFIYLYHSKFPELAKLAEQEFKDLNVGKMWPIGGKQFIRLSKALGFKQVLIIKKILNL